MGIVQCILAEIALQQRGWVVAVLFSLKVSKSCLVLPRTTYLLPADALDGQSGHETSAYAVPRCMQWPAICRASWRPPLGASDSPGGL
jgi:hypothetical protein